MGGSKGGVMGEGEERSKDKNRMPVKGFANGPGSYSDGDQKLPQHLKQGSVYCFFTRQ
jgi:hypothetical protein